jgi:hypothetical protein
MLQEIEIKDLEAGDEILISCQSIFKYLILLRTPQLGKKLHWKTQGPLYKSVKCSTKVDSIVHTYNTRKWTENKYILTNKDHNKEVYIDLAYRQILLVKKNSN